MAVIEIAPGRRVMLLDEHIIGRSSRCDTSIDDEDVSSRHVLAVWREGAWWVRDLGSTNGTELDGQELTPGKDGRWAQGVELKLGGSVVRLVDASEPRPGVLDLTSGEFLPGEPSMCSIEREQGTLASIHLEHGTQWWLEQEGTQVPLADGEAFQCDGRTYRFFSGGERHRTAQLKDDANTLSHLHLAFRVSLDEEHVAITGTLAGKTFDLGARTHHYTLLTLARHRQQDRTDPELQATSHGWVDAGELAVRLGASPTKLSVEICRIRQQLSKLGVADAADIIERRRGTGQLRIGIDDFSIEQV